LKNALHIYEIIDDYLNNRLSEADRISFEKKVEEDSGLSAKVEEARITNEAIYYASMAELKLKIGRDIQKIKYSKTTKSGNLFLGLGLILFLGYSYFILNQNNKSNTTKSAETKISIVERSNQETSAKDQNFEKKSTIIHKLPNPHQPEYISKNDKPGTEPISTIPQPLQAEKLPVVQEKKEVDTPSLKQEANKVFVLKNEFAPKELSKSSTDSVPSVKEIKPIITPKKLSYSFNPDYNELWELKYEKGTSGIYTIYNTIGKEVYRNTFGNGNETWNGMDSNGNILSVGSYIAIVRYADGKEEKIDLTIVR
jgi:hypothetical protein